MIEVADEQEVVAKVFRLFSRDGTVSCQRSLWVRFDRKRDGWAASFYKSHHELDALTGSNALDEIPADVADLAAEALVRLKKFNDEEFEEFIKKVLSHD